MRNYGPIVSGTAPGEFNRAGAGSRALFGVLLILALSCGGSSGPTELETVPLGEHPVWSASPQLEMTVEASLNDEVPSPDEVVEWTVKLPRGGDGGTEAIVSLRATRGGVLDDMQFRIEYQGTDHPTVEFLITPYPGHPGYFQSEPIDLPAPSFRILPLLRTRNGSVQFRYESAELRQAQFPGGGPRFALYDGDGNGLFEAEDLLLIDQNGDGMFDGNRNSVERFRLDESFLIDGRAFTLDRWDPAGQWVVWGTPSIPPEPRTALLIGDRAPDFRLPDRSGRSIQFSAVRDGRPTLLAYWATW